LRAAPAPNLPLDAHVPLLHVIGMNVQRHIQLDTEGDERRILLRRERKGKWIAADLLQRIGETPVKAFGMSGSP
jgi:hypothetical protein